MPKKHPSEVEGAGASQAGNGATLDETHAPSEQTAPSKAPPRLDRLPPFKVLLHNDNHNDMLEVVQAITELTPLRKEAAVQRMLEAHSRGVSLLLTTHKERAELYREQFHAKRLVVTIEAGE